MHYDSFASACSETVCDAAAEPVPASLAVRGWHQIKRIMRRVVNPPLVAVIVALVVGLTPARHWFFAHEGDSSPPPLDFFVQLLRPGAAATTPVLLLIVGTSFAELRSLLPSRDSQLTLTAVVAACVCRLLLVPAIFYGLLLLVRNRLTAADYVVLMMQAASPTNIDVAIVAHLTGSNVRETILIMFWAYVSACMTLPVWMSITIATV